jgi:hypothetical protein
MLSSYSPPRIYLAAFAAICVVALGFGLSFAQAPKPIRSPDGKFYAVIKWVGKETGRKLRETRVELYSSTGEFLASRDYSSEDEKHGFAVVRSQWTPDSQYFVYSLRNVGGHQPWHTPVDFFASGDGRFHSLDEALNDAVTHSEFELSLPDRITVELYHGRKRVTVSLGAISAKKN